MLLARTFVQTLSSESWRGLFEKNGEALVDTSVDAIIAQLKHGVVDDIADALEFIYSHAEEGLDFVLELLEAAGINMPAWATELPAADALAALWVQSQTSSRLHQVLVAAQLEAAAREGRRTRYRYVHDEDGKLQWSSAAKELLRERLSGHFANGGLTGNVSIDTHVTSEHVSLYILRGTRRQRLPLMDDASGVTAPGNIRAACCDLIYLDLADARVEIMPGEQRLAKLYARILGEVLFGRADAFVVEKSFNLAALLGSGETLRVRGRPDVAVRLESIEWEPGAGERMTARGPDCLGTLRRELKQLGQQNVLCARFAIHFKKVRRRIGVTLKPPGGIKCTRESDRLELEDLFKRMGLLGSGSDAPFWQFATRPRPAHLWRRLLRDRFDALLDEGFLIDAPLDAAPDESSTIADGAHRLVEGLDDVGVGVDPDVPARRLTDDALDGYALDPEVLAGHLRKALKLSVEPIGPLPDGVMQVGHRQMRAEALRVFLAFAPPGDLARLSVSLRDRVSGERLVLLAPPELQGDGAIDTVPLHDWIPPFGELVDHFYRRLKLRAEMDLEEVAGKARLIVRADGVYLDRKKLDITASQHIKFVRLVIAHGLAKSAAELGDELRVAGDGTMLGETITHQAKQAVARAIAKALPLDPKSPETEVKQVLKNSRGRGYEFLIETLDLAADEAG